MTRISRIIASLTVLMLFTPIYAGGVPREQCFPVEQLPPALRLKAEKWLLDALDRETLYTVIGGIKPISEGFQSVRWNLDSDDVTRLQEAQQILATFRCGDAYFAEMLTFKNAAGKSRLAHAYLVNTTSLQRKLTHDPRFWLRLGLSPQSHPATVMTSIEHADSLDRFRGFGLVFGYPRHAVDFFVNAADSEKKTGTFVKRDFINLPTFAGKTGHFVWAVPKGHTENDEDRTLRLAAEPILTAYRQRRAIYIGENKLGVVAMLRDWFDDGTGLCDPANASLAPIVESIRAVPQGACCPAVGVRIIQRAR